MAKQFPLSAALTPGLPVDDESEARYQSALKQMSEALDQRKNRSFDPVNLGYISGLQDPNVRGMGFFAEIASGMRGAAVAEREAEKENQEIAALRLEMARAEREMARKKKGFEFLIGAPAAPAEAAASAPSAPAGAPATTTGAPAAAPAKAPAVTQGDKSGRGVMIGGREITPAFIAQMSFSNPELGKTLEQQYKLTMDSIAVQPGGYVNKVTGEYTPFGGKAAVERFIPGDTASGQKAMTLSMSEEDAIAFDRARRSGDAATYYRIIDQYTQRMARPGAPAPSAAPGAAPAAGSAPSATPSGAGQLAAGNLRPGAEFSVKPPPGVTAQTPSEAKAASEIEAEVKKKLALGEAEQQLKATGEVRTAGKASLAMLPIYDRAEQILKTPGIDKVIGVLERGDIVGALGSIVEDAIRVGNFSVGVPSIRKVLQQFNTPQELIDRAAELGQLLAVLQFEQRKGLGNGTSISNFEQQMANAMGPNMTDTLRSFRQKLSYMREKAKFDAELAKTLRARKMQYEEFESTPEFESMFNDYRNRQMNIVYPSSAPAKPAAAGARPATGAAAASGPITAGSLRDRRDQAQGQR